jgi:hypothetical protein
MCTYLRQVFRYRMIVAINVETTLWNSIISLLMERNWQVTHRYDEFDAGIDFDFLIIEKEGEEIIMGWDNWLEGEIKCSEQRLSEIEKLTGLRFEIGSPVNLKPEVIDLYRKNVNSGLAKGKS